MIELLNGPADFRESQELSFGKQCTFCLVRINFFFLLRCDILSLPVGFVVKMALLFCTGNETFTEDYL